MNGIQKHSHKGLEKSDERPLAQPASLPVLVIEDDPILSERLGTILETGGYPVVCVNSETDILRLLSSSRVSGVVCGTRSRDGLDAMDFLTSLIQHHPDLSKRVIVLTSRPSDQSLAKRGDVGRSFVRKPFSTKRFLSVIRTAIGESPVTERILVADDEEPIREIMALMLGLAGYRCRHVAGGTQALKLLDSGETFDLITSDICNSHMDGLAFLNEVKRKFPEIPFLMVTAVHDVSVALASVRNGAYDYLLKPFEREQLIFVVRRALETRRLKLENRALVTELAKLQAESTAAP
jgi:DNA-binding NtrC family response regulator